MFNMITTQPTPMARNGRGQTGPRGRRRARAQTFADYAYAYKARPLPQVEDQRVIRGPFWVQVTVTDNAVVNQDLRTGNLWDPRVQGLYSSASTPLEAALQLESISLYINDADWFLETLALQEALDNGAYLSVIRQGQTQNLPLRSRIWTPYNHTQRTQGTAANGDFVAYGFRRDWVLERPLKVDLKVDTFSFRVDSAINWASGNIIAYLCVGGILAPRDTIGALVSDVSCSDLPYEDDLGGAPTAVDFATFGRSVPTFNPFPGVMQQVG